MNLGAFNQAPLARSSTGIAPPLHVLCRRSALTQTLPEAGTDALLLAAYTQAQAEGTLPQCHWHRHRQTHSPVYTGTLGPESTVTGTSKFLNPHGRGGAHAYS